MAQETRNVDYESMVDKYMNEWEGCLRFALMCLYLSGDEISKNAVKLEVNKRCRQVGH